MLQQLNTYMTTLNLLPDYISAYRKNYSMETVLVKIHNDILKAIEEQKGVLLTGLDLSAAVDTVDYNILIMVLRNMYGVGGLASMWFKDYLRNMAVQVLIGNSVSEAVGIPFSVPQGLCAGPVLYNMHSSMMDKLTQGYLVNLIGYADDKTRYNIFHLNNKGDEDSKRHNMENCMAGIAEWTHENRLKLNNEKTEFIVFASERQRKKVTSREIGTDGIKVGTADEIKYVGMWLNHSLTITKQVATVCSKVSRNISLIRKNRKYLYIESCQKLASGLVIGLLVYGNALYYGVPKRSHKASETSKLCCKSNRRQK